MGRVVCDVGVTADGFVAGPRQSLDDPLGEGGEEIHRWMFETREQNLEEIERITAAGAFIMGRNMFSPGRGSWDEEWKGWWGEEPPYHAPVFVLTHHPREPLPMEGGTTFNFVTEGPAAALELAREAAGEKDVAIAGGASTINQYLDSGALEELRLHIAPLLLGEGERIFAGTRRPKLTLLGSRSAELVTHVTYAVG